ncbi:MAG: hypothetical protein IJ362_10235, partial [Oscillospiraceae bacterium]|nr:hypothetical protein [Oscillospiraceae bacterium]
KQRADKRGFSPSLYATIVFQGRKAGESQPPRFWLLLAPKVTPAQRKKESVVTQEQRFFACGSE